MARRVLVLVISLAALSGLGSLPRVAIAAGSEGAWAASEVIGFDDHDMSGSTDLAAPNDVIAVYRRWVGSDLLVRVDFLDLPDSSWSAVDLTVEISPAPPSPVARFDIRSDGALPPGLEVVETSSELDYVVVRIAAEQLPQRGPANALSVRVTAWQEGFREPDRTVWYQLDGTATPVAYVIYAPFWGSAGGEALGYSSKDIFDNGAGAGYLQLLRACEKYKQPIAPYLTEGFLLSADWYGQREYLQQLQRDGLLELAGFAGSGFEIQWFGPEVGSKAIAQTRSIYSAFGLDTGPRFHPYSGVLKREDFQTIQDAGYSIVTPENYAYAYAFGEDYARKVPFYVAHRINGLYVLFSQWALPRYPLSTNRPPISMRAEMLDVVLHNAPSSVLVYADDGDALTGLCPECYPGVGVADFEGFLKWVAAHPWIKMTTFAQIAPLLTDAIDAGDMDPLHTFHSVDGDMAYQTYYNLSYYGGTSDGHSPLVPAGVHIEGLADYLPILSNGQPIPSGMRIGDEHTPGTIMQALIARLLATPQSSATELAWFSFFRLLEAFSEHVDSEGRVGGGTGGSFLAAGTKIGANLLGQVGKVLYAANWAKEVQEGLVGTQSTVLLTDLDFDGEQEAVLRNDRVLVMFENDGGRMDFLFSYSDGDAVSLVFSAWMLNGARFVDDPAALMDGEAALYGWPGCYGFDLAFVEAGRELESYSVETGTDSLAFRSNDGAVTKRFSIGTDGTSLEVEYEVASRTDVRVGLCVNPFSLLQSGNRERWTVADSYPYLTVSNALAGCAQLSAQPSLLDRRVQSFIDGDGIFYPYVWATYPVIHTAQFHLETDRKALVPEGVESRLPLSIAGMESTPGSFLVDDFEGGGPSIPDTYCCDSEENHSPGSDPTARCASAVVRTSSIGSHLQFNYQCQDWMLFGLCWPGPVDLSGYDGFEVTLWADHPLVLSIELAVGWSLPWQGFRLDGLRIGTSPVRFRLPFDLFTPWVSREALASAAVFRIQPPPGAGTVSLDDLALYKGTP